jgi:hypothetical protein
LTKIYYSWADWFWGQSLVYVHDARREQEFCWNFAELSSFLAIWRVVMCFIVDLLRPMTITLAECWKLFNPSPRNLSIREAMLLFVGLPNKKSFHGNSFVCKCVYKGIRFHQFIAMLLALMESRGRTLFMQS